MLRELALSLLLALPACTSSPATNPASAPVSAVAPILEFQDDHRFLSSFYPAEVHFEGLVYPTAEHAYQSAKTLDMNERRRIAAVATPADAKREGRALAQRSDWESVKFDVMERVVRDKFTRNPDVRAKLLATGDAQLEEGNTWNDRIWGISPPGSGQGENRLGKILMQVRHELRSASSADRNP